MAFLDLQMPAHQSQLAKVNSHKSTFDPEYIDLGISAVVTGQLFH